jgi:TolA-binding protein
MTLDQRMGKLEKEMHAVQRKVFPNGTPVEPEFVPATAPVVVAGSASNSSLIDITGRLDVLESQVKAMTAQVEQQGYQLRLAQSNEKALAARLDALEALNHPQAASPVATYSPTQAPAASSAGYANALAANTSYGPANAPLAAGAASTGRTAVAMPNSGDAQEDSYVYGYRLYAAKLYPQAEEQLLGYLNTYPKGKRRSFAANYLGRAYYDEGKYGIAAEILLKNYVNKDGRERAADSLSWAGWAYINLGQAQQACKVFEAFNSDFGTTAGAELKTRVAQGVQQAQCSRYTP